MAEFSNVATQTVAVNGNVLFTDAPTSVCNKGYISHRTGSGLINLKGATNTCKAKYRVEFNGNIAVPTGGTALKLCRKWAYEVKKLPKDTAEIVVCRNNFHGRTTTIVSFSIDPDAYNNYGPFTPGFVVIPYNDAEALAKVLDEHPHVAGFLVEPIQGEAGAYVPDEGYLKKCYDLCRAHNVLFIADEVQTGIARTGKLLACDYENVHPDILILGKALSGGACPVSAVLSCNEVMDVIRPGQHGSTFGGNPIAAAVAVTALEVVRDEQLADRAYRLGLIFREEMRKLCETSRVASLVRGKGLLNALII